MHTAIRRFSPVALAAIGATLGSIVLFDVYEDWQVQGNSLATTLAENSLPLALVVVILYVAYWLARRSEPETAATITKWAGVGVVGILVIGVWAFGLQVVQGQIKPFVLVTHAAIGGAVGGIFVGYSVAQAREARAETEKERQRRAALFENAPTAIADLSVESDEFVVETANAAFVDWFASDADTAVGRSLADCVTVDDHLTALQENFDAQTVYTTEIAHPVDDGRRHYRVRFVPYELDTDRGAYVIISDTTERKEAQRELQATVADLERSNEQLEQFAYIASHDLQEPLRMVSSYVDLLAHEYGDELDDEADEYIEYAVGGAERMQAMIDGLLAYSRVETQGEAFEAVDVDSLVEQTLQDLSFLVDESGATVEVGDLPTVIADRTQLEQLFQNLTKNAIEHGGDAPTVEISAEETDGEYVFAVADDGPGIPESRQERIFEIFKQGSRDSDGTGIGLAVCERIVHRHDGEIWVESAEREGTTFHFSIPRT